MTEQENLDWQNRELRARIAYLSEQLTPRDETPLEKLNRTREEFYREHRECFYEHACLEREKQIALEELWKMFVAPDTRTTLIGPTFDGE